MARQVDADHRSLPDLRIDPDMSMALSGEAIHHRQAKSGAFTQRFGGEERIEHAVEDRLADAGPGVADGYGDVLTRFERARGGGAIVEPFVSGFDDDLSAVGHRVARVDAQVEQRVFQLVRVDHGEPYPARGYRLYLDRGADCASHQFDKIGHQPVDVDWLRRQRLAAGERKQTMGQGCRTAGR